MSKHPRLGLIVGLGNPGSEYARTRHNVGHWFVDQLAASYAANFKREARFKGEICRINIAGDSIWLLKPETYMNDSGYSVAASVSYYKLSAPETLVVHDELALECGTARFKAGGGHGGHNGLRNIVQHLNSDFIRLRIGIGHPGKGEDVARYVLNRPRVSEQQLIEVAVTRALQQIELIVAGETAEADQAMSAANLRLAMTDSKHGF